MNVIFAQAGGKYARWQMIRPATFDALLAFHERIQEKEQQLPGIKVSKLIEDSTETVKGTIKGKGCLAGITRIDIEANLDVKACCMADSLMGNLGRQSFEDVWYSEAAEQLRSKPEALCVAPNCIYC